MYLEQKTTFRNSSVNMQKKRLFCKSLFYSIHSFVVKTVLIVNYLVLILGDYSCKTCCKRFTTKGSSIRHIKYYCGRKSPPIQGFIKVNEEDYRCSRCNRSYKMYSTVKRHIRHECEKKPSIECPVLGCEYKAKFRYCVTNHCRMTHKIVI